MIAQTLLLSPATCCTPFVLACCIAITWSISNPGSSNTDSTKYPHMKHVLKNPVYDQDALWEAHKKEFGRLPSHLRRNRLRILAKSHDVNNNDVLEAQELTQWVMESYRIMDRDEARERLESEDMNGDRKVSMDEIIHKRFGYTENEIRFLEKYEEQHTDTLKMIRKERYRFAFADLNHDGLLDETEYFAFYKPQHFEYMHTPMTERTLKDYDGNNDGLVSVQEFTKGVDIEGIRKSKVQTFKDLDTDKDGKLNTREIRPFALSDEESFAVEDAQQLISICDKDKDHRLSFDEILSNEDTFIESTVTVYGRNLNFVKDEL